MAILNAAVIGMGVGEKHALAYKNHQNIRYVVMMIVCMQNCTYYYYIQNV